MKGGGVSDAPDCIIEIRAKDEATAHLMEVSATLAKMRAEDRSIRRGFRFGILAGLLLWPCMVAFCWLVVFLARSIR